MQGTEEQVALTQIRRELEKNRRLALVAEKTHNPVIIADPEGYIIWCNEAFTFLTGYPPEEILGQSPLDLLRGDNTDPDTVAKINQAIADKRSFEGEIHNYARSGREYCFSISITPIFNFEKQLDGFIYILADITDRKQTEAEIRAAKESIELANQQLEGVNAQLADALAKANLMTAEAAAANQAKDEFLAQISHEIRTPLNSIIGTIEFLKSSTLDPEQAEYVGTIHSSGEALLTLINDILDLSKIQSGNFNIANNPFNLLECVEGTLDWIAPSAYAKGLELTCVTSGKIPHVVMGDETRLRQILANLLANAVKFTPSGEIFFTMKSLPIEQSANRCEIQFAIKDTDMGISQKEMENLFDSVNQVKIASSKEAGMGLAITQRLVALMSGEIWAESEPDQGSTFHLKIILETQSGGSPPHFQGVHPKLEGKRLLVAVGHASTRRLLNQLTQNWGLIPIAAPSAEDALEWIHRGEPAVDAVILETPATDSKEAGFVAEIDQQCAASRLPLIFLKQHGQSNDVTNLLQHSSLFKPIKQSALYELLLDIFDRHASVMAIHPPAQTPMLAEALPLNILLVEDNPVNQKVALRMLEKLGYSPTLAAGGREALEFQEQKFHDVIFMDIQMPEMDGNETTRQIRETFQQQPWIIALTAGAADVDRQRCLDAGMNDYLSKPIRINDLATVLKKIPQKASSAETH